MVVGSCLFHAAAKSSAVCRICVSFEKTGGAGVAAQSRIAVWEAPSSRTIYRSFLIWTEKKAYHHKMRGMKKTFVLAALLATSVFAQEKSFTVVEATIPQMQAALKSGRITSHDLVLQYLTRIATYEDKLHAAITVNPNALKEADERDRERAAGKIRGPLHGIPIAIKDNIQTTDMPTTGGMSVVWML